MERSAKEGHLSDMREIFASSSIVVLVSPRGLSSQENLTLRQEIKKYGGNVKVTKNRLARIAVSGTPYEKLKESFQGMTAAIYGTEIVDVAKGVDKIRRENDKIEVLTGVIDGIEVDIHELESLAKLLSFDELRAQLLSLIATPSRNIAGVTNSAVSSVVRVINAYSEKQ